MSRWRTLSLLTVIACAVFAAGIVDTVFPDVIPLRPYTAFFLTNLQNPSGSSLPAFWNGVHLAMVILPVIAILILVIFPLHGLTIPPLVFGQHGKSDTSHNKWHSKMAKKSVAKRILKRIKQTEERNRTLESQSRQTKPS